MVFNISVGIIDPKSHNKALGQKDGRARDVLSDDSDKPFFDGVVGEGGSRSGLNEFHDHDHQNEQEGFPAGSGKFELL